MTEQLRLLFHCAGAIEKEAAARKQLLACASQYKPAPNAIEEPQAEFMFKIDNLS
jgi:hypothetical protein